MKNPQLAIAIRNNNCAFQAYVNDIPVFQNAEGLAFNFSAPINYALKNGRNTFHVHLKQCPDREFMDKETECQVMIIKKDLEDAANAFQEVAQVDYPLGSVKDEWKLKQHLIGGFFEIELPFPNSAWVSGMDLDLQDKSLIEALYAEYRKLHQLFGLKKVDAIMQFVELREREIAHTFYENEEQSLSDTKRYMQETLDDPEWKIQGLELMNFMPTLAGFKKMISLRNEAGQTPIYFLNNKAGLRRDFTFYFYLNTDKKLTIIR